MTEPDNEPIEVAPPPPRRIFPNGAICDRCDDVLTAYSILSAMVCPGCMTDEERAGFASLNEPEYVI